MHAFVRFQTADGEQHDVPHGGIVGRLGIAALRLGDARISEAHALVSLRGGALRLLALRGRFAVGGRPLTELDLEPGLRVFFARGIWADVASVHLPDAVLALVGDALPQQVLNGVCSLVEDPRPSLVPGIREDALAVFWNEDEQWRIRLAGGSAAALLPGTTHTVGTSRLKVVLVPVDSAELGATRLQGRIETPLRIVARYDSAQIYQDGLLRLHLSGKNARVLSELVRFGGPVPWLVLAGEVWRDAPDHRRRRNLDQTLLRLRRKLDEAGVRTDLVRADGAGCIELVKGDADLVEDQT